MGTCGKLTPQRDFADSLILMGFGGLTNSIKRRFFRNPDGPCSGHLATT